MEVGLLSLVSISIGEELWRRCVFNGVILWVSESHKTFALFPKSLLLQSGNVPKWVAEII